MAEEIRNTYIGGRGKSLYKPELDEHAYNYCLLGAMDEDLAQFFGVSVTTLNKWKKKYPRFGERIRAGKLYADIHVARSLYKKAIGFICRQVVTHGTKMPAKMAKFEGSMDETFFEEGDDDFQLVKITTKEVVPDTRAQIFWLKNRQPKLWREKQEVDHTTDAKKMSHITIFELPNDGRND